MAKRKRSSAAQTGDAGPPPPSSIVDIKQASRALRTSSRKAAKTTPGELESKLNTSVTIKDSLDAFGTSPDAEASFAERKKVRIPVRAAQTGSAKSKRAGDGEAFAPDASSSTKTNHESVKNSTKDVETADPEAEEDVDANPEELKEALARPPPVNSSYLPLPWKGRLGYACLNTYLRTANPPVFSSRTCRIASILEHRHPLRDPFQPEHPTKNRPDKEQPADIARGQAYVEAIALANVRDIEKMIRWNDKYGIKFLRLSSEMFPFASHEVYGYKLASFASDALQRAGEVIAELGHRVSTHPGQFTQLGSPRKEVITASVRDLEYHCELLDLLKLPDRQNRDAVMILHMGGVFGDKQETLARFRENYGKLSQNIKDRLVLENDDVCYSVHDLLPICEELNIPLVLDYHHHNIVFDADQLREGTQDIMALYPRIAATWARKRITQKMHYSEPTPAAVTARQRRKHNPRVATLPPCANDMDLMIEAKDKEQAVFELMRTFKLPGYDLFNDVVPHQRADENKPWKPPPKTKKNSPADHGTGIGAQPPPHVPEDEVAMGGPARRVYWPPGMEEWLRPKKREVKARPAVPTTTAERAAAKRAEKAAAASKPLQRQTADAAEEIGESEAGADGGDEVEAPAGRGRRARRGW